MWSWACGWRKHTGRERGDEDEHGLKNDGVKAKTTTKGEKGGKRHQVSTCCTFLFGIRIASAVMICVQKTKVKIVNLMPLFFNLIVLIRSAHSGPYSQM
jgi:hypothetical protein